MPLDDIEYAITDNLLVLCGVKVFVHLDTSLKKIIPEVVQITKCHEWAFFCYGGEQKETRPRSGEVEITGFVEKYI